MYSSPPVMSSSPAMHAQQRGLAAARRADEHDELAVLDLEVDAVQRLDLAIGLAAVSLSFRCSHVVSVRLRSLGRDADEIRRPAAEYASLSPPLSVRGRAVGPRSSAAGRPPAVTRHWFPALRC